MILLTPKQILDHAVNINWTTEQYIKAADYIANNIAEVTAMINAALSKGAKSIELDIPGIPQ